MHALLCCSLNVRFVPVSVPMFNMCVSVCVLKHTVVIFTTYAHYATYMA